MEKIRNIAKSLFKNFFRFLFKLIYGKIVYNNDNLNSENIQIEISSNKIIFNIIFAVNKIV